MKKRIMAAATVAVGTCVGAVPSAHAQSSVTLWGLLDAGVSYISNIGGHSAWRMDDGIALPNLMGFKGTEDLGHGTRAVFQLTTQFSLNGTLVSQKSNGSGSGVGLFARNAWVGLDNDRYGKLSLGRQYDFMVDTLFADVGADMAMYGGGFYQFRDGPFAKLGIPDSPPDEAFDFDRMNGDTPLNNSVKYTSPLFGGLRFGGMYAFGGTAGNFRQNSADSFGASYTTGPFAFGAAYTDIAVDGALYQYAQHAERCGSERRGSRRALSLYGGLFHKPRLHLYVGQCRGGSQPCASSWCRCQVFPVQAYGGLCSRRLSVDQRWRYRGHQRDLRPVEQPVAVHRPDRHANDVLRTWISAR